MKSNVCKIENGIKDLDAILRESEKVAVYNELTHKQALHLQACFAGWVDRSNHFLLDFVLCTPKHRFIFFGRCPVGAVRSKTAPRDTLSGFSR